MILLETFARKRPTNSMFYVSLSLPKWVEQEFSDGALHVVDGDLLMENDSQGNSSSSRFEYSNSTLKCLSSILEMGLLCTKERPNERINMRDAVTKLEDIRSDYIESLRT
ncbi:hypothetical protein AMTR_s00010p00257080 [Amborella trichopoda]|uniref:Serine-threonine/tyrosine-protein kinase catalytic domain-containing protein n=1 Tax=Amborella trichopoda TaxID=13333 RepID=W1NGX5_AMBTC|nr:hypothetical protein AMTR_s00010p00257080 [Amborella trichopoda]